MQRDCSRPHLMCFFMLLYWLMQISQNLFSHVFSQSRIWENITMERWVEKYLWLANWDIYCNNQDYINNNILFKSSVVLSFKCLGSVRFYFKEMYTFIWKWCIKKVTVNIWCKCYFWTLPIKYNFLTFKIGLY